MTPFAFGFMIVSMLAVTCLAGWCLSRITRGRPPGRE
jgi:hypothetical protein